MKQALLIIATLIVAGGAIFFMTRDNSDSTIDVFTKKEEALIMVYKESGYVAWKGSEISDYKVINSDEMGLPNNVYIKTAEDGRGYVVLPDNSTISLDKNTEIVVSYEPKKTSVQQLLGSTYHRVESLVTGKEYEVRTPGTLAAVRGTKFAVTYDKKRRKTNVSVTESKVNVAPIERMDEIATSTAKSIEAGMTAVLEDMPEKSTTTPDAPVRSRAAMIVQKTERMAEEKRWVDENSMLDKELDKRKEERKEYMKEFIKQMKEEKEKREAMPTTTKPSDTTKERINMIETVIKEIEVKRPDLKVDDSVRLDEEQKVEPVETKTETQTTSGTLSPETNTLPTAPRIQATLKTFDFTKELLSPEEEAFTNDFYKEYETYLYVDASASICDRVIMLSGNDVVARLEKFVNGKGYILPKKPELTLLANDIITSCKDRTVTGKTSTFQSRFDETYPFSQ